MEIGFSRCSVACRNFRCGSGLSESELRRLATLFGFRTGANRNAFELGEGVALITTEALYKRKIEPLRSRLPKLTRVLLVDAPGNGIATLSLQRLLEESSPEFDIPATEPEDMALLHFTSGTTGRPKGAIHVHDAIVTHFITGPLCA